MQLTNCIARAFVEKYIQLNNNLENIFVEKYI